MPPNANVKKDLIIWSLSKSGKCTVKSAYESLCPEKSTKAGSNSPWKCIWSWKGPKRILMTNNERYKRNFSPTAACPLCGFANETVIHILRDCSIAKIIWPSFVEPQHLQHFYNLSSIYWLDANLIPDWGEASTGGILQDQWGTWLSGFSTNLGMCPFSELKLGRWSIGLRLRGTQATDSIQVNHVYREANTCADWLANQGHQQPLGYLFLKAPPPTLHQWILNYFIRVSHFRMCLM
uniref:Reverse transcriptase zinc-binding domain-containing protein n=1 Tax=Manihot esculenta TaxID=3983 RepID=A0A2C9WG69_MANES